MPQEVIANKIMIISPEVGGGKLFWFGEGDG